MALELGSLREALVEAGASPEKARDAAELAGFENRFDFVDRALADMQMKFTTLEGKVNLLTGMVGFNLAISLALLWRVFAHGV